MKCVEVEESEYKREQKMYFKKFEKEMLTVWSLWFDWKKQSLRLVQYGDALPISSHEMVFFFRIFSQ